MSIASSSFMSCPAVVNVPYQKFCHRHESAELWAEALPV